jgi:hypothetical protein
MIKIDFEFTTEFGIFKDALYLPDDHTLSDNDIEVIKKERVDNWLAIVNPAPVEETPAEGV